MTSGADAAAAFCAVLVDEWVRAGLTDAVVAPGSRSTPVLVALGADGRLRVHVVLDERAAGFTALGLAVATGRPAPVVTTSGTAAVELHPAVVEADQAGVPLIAVTADRPPELHHVGAPQTVPQDDLYGTATRWTVVPGVAEWDAAGTWRSLASRTVAVATGAPTGRPGPVHCNLAFREPLLGRADGLPPGRNDGHTWHRPVPGPGAGPAPEVVELLVHHRHRRGLIVAGSGAGDPDAVAAMAATLGWPVLADPRSGLRRPGRLTVAAADTLLRVPEVAASAPEIVLRLGAPWASKVVNQWLDGVDPSSPQVLVDPGAAWTDPGHRVSLVVGADPTALAGAVIAAVGDGAVLAGPWPGWWAGLEETAQEAIDAALAGAALSEPGLARALTAAVPDDGVLVTSSSMPVRDVEWWGRPRTGLRVVANRGANGIDGVVATAVGVALTGAPTVALLGDLAFLYDAGALLWARDRPIDLTLVVADNDGGGIFSFLPQRSALAVPTFERFWGTPHGAGVDLVALAAAYGVDGRRLSSLDELPGAVGSGPGLRLVVVPTDRDANLVVHARIHEAVAAAVAGRA